MASFVNLQDPAVKTYKLLRGIHAQTEVSDEVCPHCQGKKTTAEGFVCPRCQGSGCVLVNKIYDARDSRRSIVPSHLDLEAVHGFEKFQSTDRLQRAAGSEALQQEIDELRREVKMLRRQLSDTDTEDLDEDVEDGLEEMTVKQLREYADQHDIELGDATRKDEILNTIRSALDAA